MKRSLVASTVVCLFAFVAGLVCQNARAENLEVQGNMSVKYAGDTYIWNARYSNNADPPAIIQYKSRGTSIDAHGAVVDSDCLGKNTFVGSNSGSWLHGCLYRVMVDGTPNSGFMPSRFMIDTCPNSGTAFPQTRMTIKADGKVGIGTTAPAYLLEVSGDMNCTGVLHYGTLQQNSSRDYKLGITPVPAVGRSSLILGAGEFERNGAWDLLDKLNVVDFEYKTREKRWRMPDGRIVSSLDEATSTVTRNMNGHVVKEVLQPDELGAQEFSEWTNTGSGAVHRGFIAEELPDEFTTDHKSVLISDITANNTAALKEAKRRILELEKADETLKSAMKDLEAADESLLSQVRGLATGALRIEDFQKGTENGAVVVQLTESVLRQLGVDPWVEIPLADAIESRPETTETKAVKAVTKYRLNLETGAAEAYTVQEEVTEQVPTGRTMKALKAGVRFDETTGKAYKWQGLPAAETAQKVAALRGANQLAAVPAPAAPQAVAAR